MKTTKSIFVAFIFVFAFSISSCDSGGDDPKPSDSTGGVVPDTGGGMSGTGGGNSGGTDATLAPAFSLTSVNGGTVKLSDYKGKVVVLFFFGNSCPACKASAPTVQSTVADAFSSNSDVVVLGIDQWDGTKSSVEGFQNSTNVGFDLLLNGSSAASSYSTTYDRLIVIDKEGYIRFEGSRSAGSDAASAKSTVDTYLK